MSEEKSIAALVTALRNASYDEGALDADPTAKNVRRKAVSDRASAAYNALLDRLASRSFSGASEDAKNAAWCAFKAGYMAAIPHTDYERDTAMAEAEASAYVATRAVWRGEPVTVLADDGERATILVDGYEASNTVPSNEITSPKTLASPIAPPLEREAPRFTLEDAETLRLIALASADEHEERATFCYDLSERISLHLTHDFADAAAPRVETEGDAALRADAERWRHARRCFDGWRWDALPCGLERHRPDRERQRVTLADLDVAALAGAERLASRPPVDPKEGS